MDAEPQEIRQARQRASVKWLLSKAFNNRVPDNLKEPFYRDHENQERLKPQIIVEMGNATLYCQTLSNLYSDPNYQSLNHWSILQTLSRKGVPVAESSDMPLTETVLIQTNPLRINAHMSVIESLMILYAKEIASGDRILNAIRRISGSHQVPSGQTHEQLLLAWVSHTCAALKKRIVADVEAGIADENGVRLQVPDIPPVREYQDLCDGICLALLVSYYCPKVVSWTSVRINYLPAVEDSIHNVLLVSNFSQKYLPYNIFHMTPEDITYMRGSMKLNLILLLADLFNLFEIHPAKCVSYPGMDSQDAIAKRNAGANEHGICHRRGLTMPPVTPIPDLRSELDLPSGSPTNRPPFQVVRSETAANRSGGTSSDLPQIIQNNNFANGHDGGGFVVHKSRGVTTLSSMQTTTQQQSSQEPLVPARLRQAKEKSNIETKADERGDYAPAGRPSNWEQTRRPSYAGRRSRRNSSSEDSQLTIENFGGSQDQLNALGQYERERDRDRERKISNASAEPAVAVRSSIVDARGTLQLGYDTDSGSEKQDRETEKYSMRRQESVDNVSLLASNAHLNNSSHSRGSPLSGVQKQQQHSIDRDFDAESVADSRAGGGGGGGGGYDMNEGTPVRKISQGSLGGGKTNAWYNNQNDSYDDDVRSLESATKLNNIRMKLEEKRRRIELDKRRIELALLRHQEKIKLMANDLSGVGSSSITSGDRSGPSSLGDRHSYQDDLESCAETSKWEVLSNDSKRSPDMDTVDLDKYQQSIAIMNMNLQDIQQDIQRLATQQSQIQAQQLQAQQLMQAQHITNILNQQTYGSQQHLADHYQQRSMFGSTPHLPQAFNPPMNAYNSRPPSRDPYQTQMQQQALPMQYVNEHGQYMSPPQQAQPPPLAHVMHQQPPHYMQPQSMYNDNAVPYNNHYGTGIGGQPQPPQPPPHYLPQHMQQVQPSPPYMSRQSVVGYGDDYGQPPYRGGRDHNSPQANHQFYLQESVSSQPTPAPQRRTWAQSYEQQQQQQPTQHNAQPMVDVNAWQSQQKHGASHGERPEDSPGGGGFWGKQQQQQQSQQQQHQGFVLHQNGGGGGELKHLFQVHSSPQHAQRNVVVGESAVVHRQHSLTNLRDNRSPSNAALPKSTMHQQQQPSADDMMAPQSICFIGDEEDVDEIERNIIETMQSTRISSDYGQMQQQQQQSGQRRGGGGGGAGDGPSSEESVNNKLNITSGNLTYRIPSPSRPSLHANSFQDPREDDRPTEKGFYISFDDEQPKRPKPPLRAKRSPKKEKSMDGVDHKIITKRESLSQLHNNNINESLNGVTNTSNPKNSELNNATYNKYTDAPMPPIKLRQHGHDESSNGGTTNNQSSSFDSRRHMEDMTNQPQSPTHLHSAATRQHNENSTEVKGKALVIGTDVDNLDPESVDEMERRKEKIMLLSLQRRQQQEEAKARKEIEASQRREREREKEEERARKKEEQMARRAAILEQHRLKKAIEEAEREGKTLDRTEISMKQQSQSASVPRLRTQRMTRPRPKTIHVDDGSVDISEASSISSSRGKKGSNTNLTGYGQLSSNSMRRDFYRGSQDSLTVKESPDEYPSTSSTPIGRRGSYKTSREPTSVGERGRNLSRISVAKGSTLNFRGRKSNSLMNLCDSGLGRATPPRRAPSPGMATGRHLPSPSGPGSLPPGFISKRRGFDDGSSDMSSTPNSMMEYSGPKLYKQPAAKSNRGIILNAVEYCVFPGAVNREAKQKVLDKIQRSEAKHFLILFRDAGCQFRALYSYIPETEQVTKLYGTGPSQVDEVMFDKFFKYNSGGKCFSQVHTKHLTVTIDAFTIHNSLWQGKKVQLPSKKDMALVI